nr:hypothetical protein BCU37_22565 [Vibrio splendidus]
MDIDYYVYEWVSVYWVGDVSQIAGKKIANRNNRNWLIYIVNKNRFTNNVSWLGDPRLKKGRYIHCS